MEENSSSRPKSCSSPAVPEESSSNSVNRSRSKLREINLADLNLEEGLHLELMKRNALKFSRRSKSASPLEYRNTVDFEGLNREEEGEELENDAVHVGFVGRKLSNAGTKLERKTHTFSQDGSAASRRTTLSLHARDGTSFGKKFFQVILPLDEDKPLDHRTITMDRNYLNGQVSVMHYPLSTPLFEVMALTCKRHNLRNPPDQYCFFFPTIQQRKPIPMNFTVAGTLELQAEMFGSEEKEESNKNSNNEEDVRFDGLMLVVEPNKALDHQLDDSPNKIHLEKIIVESYSRLPKIGSFIDTKYLSLLEGERVDKKMKGVQLLQKTAECNAILPQTVLYLTNFRMIFHSKVAHQSQSFSSPPLNIMSSAASSIFLSSSPPSKSSKKVKKKKRMNSFLSSELQVSIPWMSIMQKSNLQGDQIKLKCFDCRYYRIGLPSTMREDLWNRLNSYDSLPIHSKVFAFSYEWRPSEDQQEGWNQFSFENEFRRMRILKEDWQIVNWNQNYDLIPTYPNVLCIPTSMNQEQIKQAINFRSKGRIPVLTWKNPNGKQTITRSSQPMVGLMGKTSAEDERLMIGILSTNGRMNEKSLDGIKLKIIDARPKVNAVGNKAMGLGYEYNTDHCTISFMGIDNIHVMRDSILRVYELVNRSNSDDSSWLSLLEATGWMKHLKSVLDAAKGAVKEITNGESVLIHCSDGWDRTAQICSLAQLMLDPYYRTIDGFAVLIEKDWLSFGHKFALRCGQIDKDMEKSPTFLQWLDCVFQMYNQFPCSFEFNNKLLLLLADEVYLCRFGTFLFNTEKQRRQYSLEENTVSIWSYIDSKRDEYLNQHYRREPSPLVPVTLIRKLVFWDEFFLRYDRIDTNAPGASIGFETLGKTQDVHKAVIETFHKLQRDLHQLSSNNLNIRRSSLTFKEVVILAQQEKRVKEMAVKAEAELIVNQIIQSVFDIENQRRNMKRSNFITESASIDPLEEFFSNNPQPTWIPDHWVSSCNKCKKSFTRVRRRHHCRACGHIFCGTCSSHSIEIPHLMFFTPVRVCDDCLGGKRHTTQSGIHLP
eukprot:TRINITY_DN5167_c0_g1_i2.p2 TRINITY_DN5167_c0_g1~~TRINITY_DN5167_c0_g1_i2.p2  ORF type:complete len:1051 (+),score=338.99 TRINITY_DN5167_c0_g1_i2:103-3255(+)